MGLVSFIEYCLQTFVTILYQRNICQIRQLAEEKVADTLVAIDKTVLLTLKNVLAKVRTL